MILVFDLKLSALPANAQKTKATKQPNIVFIISDDHRWDALGAAGNTKIKTPVLDKLAREGAYFQHSHLPETGFACTLQQSRSVLRRLQITR